MKKKKYLGIDFAEGEIVDATSIVVANHYSNGDIEIVEQHTLMENANAIIDVTKEQNDIQTHVRKKYIRDEQCNTVIDPKLNLGNEGYFKQWEEGEITEEEFLKKSKMNLKMVEILYTRMGRIAQFEKARGQRIKVN